MQKPTFFWLTALFPDLKALVLKLFIISGDTELISSIKSYIWKEVGGEEEGVNGEPTAHFLPQASRSRLMRSRILVQSWKIQEGNFN